MNNIPNGFFAYPSRPPLIGATIRKAVEKINSGSTIKIKTWEEIYGEGLILIDKICEEIDSAQLFLADLTHLNPNVLFELGYAVAKNKRIWPILDESFEDSKNKLEEFETLTTIGYFPYINSDNIVTRFHTACPHESLEDTIYKKSIEQNLIPNNSPGILYLKCQYNDDVSLHLTRIIEKKKIKVTTSDPKEISLRNLTWYARNINAASAVVCHLTNPNRSGADFANSIYTLVAGMAYGFKKDLLMLIENDGEYLAPLDVRSILRKYQNNTEAATFLNEWIDPIVEKVQAEGSTQKTNISHRKLADKLKELQFGDPVAENESDELDQYFVETAAYEEALKGNYLIFVGRKGAGKTANLLKLASALQSPQNLICKIQPIGYELHSLLLFLRDQTEFNKGNSIESLWKFLIYSEIAKSVVESINNRPSHSLDTDEIELIELITDTHGEVEDFGTRLDKCINDISEYRKSTSKNDTFANLSEALHTGTLRKLSKLLPRVLQGKKRVAILMDNLDKAWDKQEDIEDLSDFLLGLLDASERILRDLKHDLKSSNINVTLTIFLRSDIFNKILDIAPEPDKISHSRLRWKDHEQLLRIVEQRFIASHDDKASADEMWEKYFCPEINGIPTAKYLTGRILPRPRDLVLFVGQSVREAINRQHTTVEREDVLAAEKECSQNAFKSLLVECSSRVPDIEKFLYEFTGSKPIINHNDVEQFCVESKLSESAPEIINLLLEVNFLGFEVSEEDFRFPEDPQELQKNKAQARNLARHKVATPRYKIHPAFAAFLELDESEIVTNV